jgi:hypothetical protein
MMISGGKRPWEYLEDEKGVSPLDQNHGKLLESIERRHMVLPGTKREIPWILL